MEESSERPQQRPAIPRSNCIAEHPIRIEYSTKLRNKVVYVFVIRVLTRSWEAAGQQWCSGLCRREDRKQLPAREKPPPWEPPTADSTATTAPLRTEEQRNIILFLYSVKTHRYVLGQCILILPARVLSSKMTASDALGKGEGGWKGRPCSWAQCSRASVRWGWGSSRWRRCAAETLSKGLVLVLRSRAAWSTLRILSGTSQHQDQGGVSQNSFKYNTEEVGHCASPTQPLECDFYQLL